MATKSSTEGLATHSGIWDGSASLANYRYGKSYGKDWEYVSAESQDIKVDGKIVKIGDKMPDSKKWPSTPPTDTDLVP